MYASYYLKVLFIRCFMLLINHYKYRSIYCTSSGCPYYHFKKKKRKPVVLIKNSKTVIEFDS